MELFFIRRMPYFHKLDQIAPQYDLFFLKRNLFLLWFVSHTCLFVCSYGKSLSNYISNFKLRCDILFMKLNPPYGTVIQSEDALFLMKAKMNKSCDLLDEVSFGANVPCFSSILLISITLRFNFLLAHQIFCMF